MKQAHFILILVLCSVVGVAGALDDFGFTANAAPGEVSVRLSMPSGAYIAADSLKLVLPDGERLPPAGETVQKDGEAVFVHGAMVHFKLPDGMAVPEGLRIAFQGCTATLCLRPTTVALAIDGLAASPSASVEPSQCTSSECSPLLAYLERYQIATIEGGYLPPGKFRKLLHFHLGRITQPPEIVYNLIDLQHFSLRHGLWAVALLLIPLGLLLNLTPCVLPLIPVSLSLIGAMTHAPATTDASGDRRRARRFGFRQGLLYGMAQMAVYGGLGLLAALGGSRFGAFNESPWFNWGVALLFVWFALAMFDVVSLDLSRFRPQRRQSSAPGIVAPLLLGALSALLASACVAPVLLSVLLLTADLHAQGSRFALLLPWMLGLGLATPWPFLGAGIARLPAPGAWMQTLKRAFGVLILLTALYYLYLGFAVRAPGGEQHLPEEWHTAPESLAQATPGQPVLLYFWGKACRSCTLLSRHTFQDAAVRRELASWFPIAIQADDPANEAICDYFQIKGMPTFVLLYPLLENQPQ